MVIELKSRKASISNGYRRNLGDVCFLMSGRGSQEDISDPKMSKEPTESGENVGTSGGGSVLRRNLL